eukprot:1186802-Prymnesium_polylepis.1
MCSATRRACAESTLAAAAPTTGALPAWLQRPSRRQRAGGTLLAAPRPATPRRASTAPASTRDARPRAPRRARPPWARRRRRRRPRSRLRQQPSKTAHPAAPPRSAEAYGACLAPA